jgi:hypothetical protein
MVLHPLEAAVNNHTEDQPGSPDAEPSAIAENLSQRNAVRPFRTIDDLASPGIFETDEELEEFLAFHHMQRRGDRSRPCIPSFWTPT